MPFDALESRVRSQFGQNGMTITDFTRPINKATQSPLPYYRGEFDLQESFKAMNMKKVRYISIDALFRNNLKVEPGIAFCTTE